MEASKQSVLYLRLKKRIYMKPERTVALDQIARLLTNDDLLEKRLKRLEIYQHKKSDGNRVVIDLLQIVKIIHDAVADIEIEAFGDPQVLIMIEEKTVKPRIPILIVTWLLLFFGSGLAIMNFHTDVSMKEVHIRIVKLITGEQVDHPLWFQIPYSIGIGVGMIVFFNHLFRKRFNEEPNPLEVELHMYEENVNAYVIAEEMRKKSDYNQTEENNHG